MSMLRSVSKPEDRGRGDVLTVVTKKKDGRLRIQHLFPEQGRTKQQFREECDINFIMKRYTKTGVLPELIRTDGKYGDFSEANDFRAAQDIIVHANAQFAALSAKQRERFNNDPARFLDFMGDRSNEDEARKLGFLKPKEKAPDTVPDVLNSTPEPKAKETKSKRPKGDESAE